MAIWHRHTRGKVIDLHAEVCRDSYLENSTVAKGSDIYFSRLFDSWAESSSVIRTWTQRGDIRGSSLILSVVKNSKVYNSKAYDSVIEDSIVEGSNIRGGLIKRSTVKDAWIGNAILENVTIDQPMRIGVGHWTRPPRYFEINNDITVGVGITESTNGHAYIGCRRKPIKLWLKGAERFRKVMGWDEATIDMIAANLREWL